MDEEAAISERKTGHVKKRALKNKALAISFDEKDLKDYVTGFHKRKKKRRKEANKQQEEALRRKRNEERIKRKLERELAYGGVPPTDDTETGEIDDNQEEETDKQVESVAATKTYENDDLKVTVVTKEINPDEESFPSERKEAPPAVSSHPVVVDKKKSVPINNKKPFKKVASKHKSQPKQRSKREKRKGKKPGNK